MKNLFVVGMSDGERELLEALPHAKEVNFHGVLTMDEIRPEGVIPVDELIEKAIEQLESFDGTVDGIVANWDFPVNAMIPILRERFGLRTISLEAVLKCEHKLWSRMAQKEVVPRSVPGFEGIDPFDEDATSKISLAYPFWIKPVIAYCSHLGFYVDDDESLEHALVLIRENIARLAEPATRILERVELPPELSGTDGSLCIAESIIGGHQCTVEGYIYDGSAEVYGIVDSLRERNLSSFASYRYPSTLPTKVQRRIIRNACEVVEDIGLDNYCFNIEYFWDERTNRIWLLEINTRLSESHVNLFYKVDGASNQAAMVDLAMGREPKMPQREGEHNVAGKFFVRRFSDALVTRVPAEEELEQIARDMPGTIVQVRAEEGRRLSELPDQDSYSYELATVIIGGESQNELEHRYRRVQERLMFEFEDIEDRGGPQMADVHNLLPPPILS